MTADDLAREFAALNDAMAKSHGLLADMRAERKLMAEQLGVVRQEIRDGFTELVAGLVKEQIDRLGVETDNAISDTLRKIGGMFDEYVAISLGIDPQSKAAGKEPIPDLIARARRAGVPTATKNKIRQALRANVERDNSALGNTFDPREDA